jgi:hypothetical protein
MLGVFQFVPFRFIYSVIRSPFVPYIEKTAAADIQGNVPDHFFHRHGREPYALDPFLFSQRFFERLAEHNAEIFIRMMDIDLEIAFAYRDIQIEKTQKENNSSI